MGKIAEVPLPGLDQPQMAALAAELGAELLPTTEILKRFDLTEDALKHLLRNDAQFRMMIKDFKREWNSPMSAKDRIKLKALLMVEDNLISLHTMFNNINTNPTARMDAFKQMVTLADAAPKKDVLGDGPKFNLTLNLGAHACEPFTISAEASAHLEAGDKNE